MGVLFALVMWLGPVDHVTTVEFNTFGDQPRTAIIYRGADNSVVDWRWFANEDQIPKAIRPGVYVAVWNDSGKPRTVYCQSIRYTRTRDDRELTERSSLPEHKRRKLSR